MTLHMGSPIGSKEKSQVRQMNALTLRKEGYSYEAIGKALGVSNVQAYNDIKAILRRKAEDQAPDRDEMRQLHRERLDEMLKAIWSYAIGNEEGTPSLPHFDRAQKILKDIADLEGYSIPVEQKHKIEGNFNIETTATVYDSVPIELLIKSKALLDDIKSSIKDQGNIIDIEMCEDCEGEGCPTCQRNRHAATVNA